MRGGPLVSRIGAGGDGGPGHVAEDGDYMIEGHVGDGFGGDVCAIAVDNACNQYREQVSATILLVAQNEKKMGDISDLLGHRSHLLRVSRASMPCIDDHATGYRAAVSSTRTYRIPPVSQSPPSQTPPPHWPSPACSPAATRSIPCPSGPSPRLYSKTAGSSRQSRPMSCPVGVA